MRKKILLILATLIGAFLIAVALQPSAFLITRSGEIAAPPSVVFAQVNDLRQWKTWSPWAKLDPKLKENYAGPTTGQGATYAWKGNREVGEGRMTIMESRAGELLRIKLEFLKPFAATNTAEFIFRAEGSGTRVTWTMFGENNFSAKAFGLFMNMDKMIGGDFEKGLAQLKTVVETGAGN